MLPLNICRCCFCSHWLIYMRYSSERKQEITCRFLSSAKALSFFTCKMRRREKKWCECLVGNERLAISFSSIGFRWPDTIESRYAESFFAADTWTCRIDAYSAFLLSFFLQKFSFPPFSGISDLNRFRILHPFRINECMIYGYNWLMCG